MPNCATVDHYVITAMNSDGTPGSVIMAVPATATTATVTDLILCTSYAFGVEAVGPEQQFSAVGPPAAPAFTQGLPSQAPGAVTVSIVLQGLNSSGDIGTFNPLKVDDYCTSLTGDLSALSPYAPLSSMTKQWLGLDDAAHAATAGSGNNLIDALASTGGLVLPFSYTKAVMTGTASSPVFHYQDYSPSDVANSLPNKEATVLNNEVKSIRQIWPLAKILIVGHSNGGLIAQRWWLKYGAANPQGVVHVFSLDSPINGVSVGKACTVAPDLCNSLGVGTALASFYQQLWNNQRTNDPKWVTLDSTSQLFTPIGTTGDPVYDAADYLPLAEQIGTVSPSLLHRTGLREVEVQPLLIQLRPGWSRSCLAGRRCRCWRCGWCTGSRRPGRSGPARLYPAATEARPERVVSRGGRVAGSGDRHGLG